MRYIRIALEKVPVDLAEIRGYNNFKVIYLWGMALAFPVNVQKEVYGCEHGSKKCGQCGR